MLAGGHHCKNREVKEEEVVSVLESHIVAIADDHFGDFSLWCCYIIIHEADGCVDWLFCQCINN